MTSSPAHDKRKALAKGLKKPKPPPAPLPGGIRG